MPKKTDWVHRGRGRGVNSPVHPSVKSSVYDEGAAPAGTIYNVLAEMGLSHSQSSTFGTSVGASAVMGVTPGQSVTASNLVELSATMDVTQDVTSDRALETIFDVTFSNGTITPTVGSSGTYARTDTQNYIDTNGRHASVSANNPAYDHTSDGATNLGLLVEGPNTNYLIRSDDHDAGWSTTNLTVDDDGLSNPADTFNTANAAARLTDNTTSGVHKISQSPTLDQDTVYTLCAHVKDVDRGYAFLQVRTHNNQYPLTRFNLSTETVAGQNPGANNERIRSGIEPGPNGYSLIWMTFDSMNGATGINVDIGPSDSGSHQYIGTGESIDISEAWLVEGYFPSSYISTTTTTESRGGVNLSYSQSGQLSVNDMELEITLPVHDFSHQTNSVHAVPERVLFSCGDLEVVMTDNDIKVRPGLGTELSYTSPSGFTEGTSTLIKFVKDSTTGTELWVGGTLRDSSAATEHLNDLVLGSVFYVGRNVAGDNYANSVISSVKVRNR